MKYKKTIFYTNIFLGIVALVFALNTFSASGHDLIQKAIAGIGGITGEGNVNYLTRYVNGSSTSNQIASSIIYDDGTKIGIGTATPSTKLHILDTNNNAGLREKIEATGTGSLAGINLLTHSYNWYIDNRGGMDTPNDRLAIYNNTPTEVLTILPTGNVGIGTTNPGALLEVHAPSAGATPVLRVANDGNTTGQPTLDLYRNIGDAAQFVLNPGGGSTGGLYIRSIHGTGNIIFQTISSFGGVGSNERMRINYDGNVGIGTVAPTFQLDVSRTGGSNLGMWANLGSIVAAGEAAGSYPSLGYNISSNVAGFKYKATDYASWIKFQSGGMIFNTAPSGTVGSAITATPAMTILQTGNVGIRTTTPDRPLVVYQPTAATSAIALDGVSNYAGIDFRYAGSRMGYIWQESTGNLYYNTNAGLHFRPGNVESVTLTSAGNVGIGTTGPMAKLDVNGIILSRGSSLSYAGITNAGVLNYDIINGNLDLSSYTTNLAASTAMRFTTSNSGTPGVRMTILGTGNVGIGTTTPGYTLTVNGTAWVTSGAWSGSDARWKKDIYPIDGALSKVLQLDGVSYNWRQDEFPKNKFDDKTHLGFIAQDVEKIIPELVTTGADGYKGLDYNGFSALLVNALKEQQTQLESQQAQIKELKEEIKFLETKVR